MLKQKGLYFSTGTIAFPIVIVLLMWFVFWAEIRFHYNFTEWGVYPQKPLGLRGVIFGPFIHSSLKHLFNNSVPMLVLTTALFYFYNNIKWRVLILGTLAAGLATWVIGRPAYHIGASGVVYMLAAFLFFKGIFSKHYQLTALSFVVVFLYGSLLWYVFPIDAKISWEGHLSGFLVGIVFAILFRDLPIEKKKYVWEEDDFDPDEDPFLRQFDADGNFIEIVPETEEIEGIDETLEKQSQVVVTYTIKKRGTTSEDSL